LYTSRLLDAACTSALSLLKKGLLVRRELRQLPNGDYRDELQITDMDRMTVIFRQNRRDLPRDIPLDSVVVLRYEKKSKSENKGKVPTEMELVLEQTQQGTSYEVSVSAEGVEELKRKVKIKGEKKESLLTLRQKPEHQSDTKVFTMTMEILLEPTSNKLMVEIFDTSAGNPVKEILLKLNLPDHKSILTDSKILKDGGEGT
ncbi:hypothetical protein Tco_0221300, partial [Tanacetum coccineum]